MAGSGALADAFAKEEAKARMEVEAEFEAEVEAEAELEITAAAAEADWSCLAAISAIISSIVIHRRACACHLSSQSLDPFWSNRCSIQNTHSILNGLPRWCH